jgi:hypothetical protein|tara:strand:- start:485 stop:688 length:204 start_codon:yes stop_codon:yes gene_type:complete
MLGKIGTLVVIFILLLVFYLVISWGAGTRKGSMTAEFPSPEITGYLKGVRYLILMIAIVSLILWLFL